MGLAGWFYPKVSCLEWIIFLFEECQSPLLLFEKQISVFFMRVLYISYFVYSFSYIVSCRVHLRWRVLAILALGLGISLVHFLSVLGLLLKCS